MSGSTASRRYNRASAKALEKLCERRLKGNEFVELIPDGKCEGADEMVVALGGGSKGKKRFFRIH